MNPLNALPSSGFPGDYVGNYVEEECKASDDEEEKSPAVIEAVSRERNWRVIHDDATIQRKLKTELTYAREFFAREVEHFRKAEDLGCPCQFRYAAPPEKFKGRKEIAVFPGLDRALPVASCAFIGTRTQIEDEHLVTPFSLEIGEREVPGQFFGVFDGHRGREVASHVKENIVEKLCQSLQQHNPENLTDLGIWNALKLVFVPFDKEIQGKFGKAGTTALIAMLLEGKLWVANLGDSRAFLVDDRSGEILPLTEDAKPSGERYRKGIEKRGGHAYGPRLNGKYSVARALESTPIPGMNPRSKVTMLPMEALRQKHLVLASDGLFSRTSAEILGKSIYIHSEDPVEILARNLVYSAYQENSRELFSDNITAIVAQF